jgi:hypothetical protein
MYICLKILNKLPAASGDTHFDISVLVIYVHCEESIQRHHIADSVTIACTPKMSGKKSVLVCYLSRVVHTILYGSGYVTAQNSFPESSTQQQLESIIKNHYILQHQRSIYSFHCFN